MDPALLALVCCPRCGATLAPTRAGTECAACATAYPEPGGIPCLMPDPPRALEGWRREVQRFGELIEQSLAGLDEARQRVDLLPRTRQRLDRMRAAHAENGERIIALFRQAGLAPEVRLGGSGGGEFSLIEYYEQILRDWAWDRAGGTENARALELVAETIGSDQTLGKVLVLGAGPCRLAHDLHRRYQPTLTVALDINPLLLLAARRVLDGEPWSLWEFPADPRGIDNTCVDHVLQAPAGQGATTAGPGGLHLVLADAFATPLRPDSFDTVVTPWFIDIVPVDLRESIALIHRLLVPGGRWLHYGPLSYPEKHPHLQRYSHEELHDLIDLAAFARGPTRITTIDYMHSRALARGKSADVLTFAARKEPLPTSYPAGANPPAWLLLPHLPVPRFAGLDAYQPEHPMLAWMAALIDGQRSLGDLRARMIQDHGARPDAALGGTRAVLSMLWQQASPRH